VLLGARHRSRSDDARREDERLVEIERIERGDLAVTEQRRRPHAQRDGVRAHVVRARHRREPDEPPRALRRDRHVVAHGGGRADEPLDAAQRLLALGQVACRALALGLQHGGQSSFIGRLQDVADRRERDAERAQERDRGGRADLLGAVVAVAGVRIHPFRHEQALGVVEPQRLDGQPAQAGESADRHQGGRAGHLTGTRISVRRSAGATRLGSAR
jgi:hypothetical protein